MLFMALRAGIGTGWQAAEPKRVLDEISGSRSVFSGTSGMESTCKC